MGVHPSLTSRSTTSGTACASLARVSRLIAPSRDAVSATCRRSSGHVLMLHDGVVPGREAGNFLVRYVTRSTSCQVAWPEVSVRGGFDGGQVTPPRFGGTKRGRRRQGPDTPAGQCRSDRVKALTHGVRREGDRGAGERGRGAARAPPPWVARCRGVRAGRPPVRDERRHPA